MELLCIQSQEHPELPLAELKAVMECEDIDAEIDHVTEGLVLLKDISQDNFMDYYQILTKRLGYTHEVHEHILKTDVENLDKDVLGVDWSSVIDENFAVRVKRIRSEVDTVGYERKLGTLILENSQGIKVNLSKPNTLVRVVAYGDECYYISGSTTLTRYDSEWNKVSEAKDPFAGFENEVNHIGDIDVYDGKIYAGVEYFMDGESKNIQIAVYDAESYQLVNTYSFDESSGQTEVSGIAVDPDSGSIWMTSWTGDESGRYLYRYDLENGSYKGKVHLQCPPQWLQGIAYYNGCLYMTADDGTADLGEPDHVYKTRIAEDSTTATVVLERTLDDVTLPTEVHRLYSVW